MLADPLRLTMLRRLTEGPATVAQLVSLTGDRQSSVSNHLAVLREHGLVEAHRDGRQMLYRLRSPSVMWLIEALVGVAGGSTQPSQRVDPLASARTCYGHLAGMLGVRLFDVLNACGVIGTPDKATGDVPIKPVSRAWLAGLGVDVGGIQRTRRRPAFTCLDWTEGRPHLGGALAAELCRVFLDRGWIKRTRNSRIVSVTASGKRALKRQFGLAA